MQDKYQSISKLQLPDTAFPTRAKKDLFTLRDRVSLSDASNHQVPPVYQMKSTSSCLKN